MEVSLAVPLDVVTDLDLSCVRVDKQTLGLVQRNLVVDAIKVTPSGGKVLIQARRGRCSGPDISQGHGVNQSMSQQPRSRGMGIVQTLMQQAQTPRSAQLLSLLTPRQPVAPPQTLLSPAVPVNMTESGSFHGILGSRVPSYGRHGAASLSGIGSSIGDDGVEEWLLVEIVDGGPVLTEVGAIALYKSSFTLNCFLFSLFFLLSNYFIVLRRSVGKHCFVF